MQNPHGYAIITEPGKRDRECDTAKCSHCQRIMHIPVGCRPEDLGGYCRVCDAPICPSCVATGICDPFMAKIERQEARGRLLRDMGLGA